MNDSIKLAKFTLALHEVQERINNEIIPDDELLQTLDLAAQSIDAYLKAYRLEAVPVHEGRGMKVCFNCGQHDDSLHEWINALLICDECEAQIEDEGRILAMTADEGR